jgi:hypothetical protein
MITNEATKDSLLSRIIVVFISMIINIGLNFYVGFLMLAHAQAKPGFLNLPDPQSSLR